jgi:hypothetical protein
MAAALAVQAVTVRLVVAVQAAVQAALLAAAAVVVVVDWLLFHPGNRRLKLLSM